MLLNQHITCLLRSHTTHNLADKCSKDSNFSVKSQNVVLPNVCFSSFSYQNVINVSIMETIIYCYWKAIFIITAAYTQKTFLIKSINAVKFL